MYGLTLVCVVAVNSMGHDSCLDLTTGSVLVVLTIREERALAAEWATQAMKWLGGELGKDQAFLRRRAGSGYAVREAMDVTTREEREDGDRAARRGAQGDGGGRFDSSSYPLMSAALIAA